MASSSDDKDSVYNNPGLHGVVPDEETKGYIMQQTMFRIKDPKVILDSCSRVSGMSLLKQLDIPEMKFSLYFLGYVDTSEVPTNPVDRMCGPLVEITHDLPSTVTGVLKLIQNSKDITMGIQNLADLACERFERLGEEFVKRLDNFNISARR